MQYFFIIYTQKWKKKKMMIFASVNLDLNTIMLYILNVK